MVGDGERVQNFVEKYAVNLEKVLDEFEFKESRITMDNLNTKKLYWSC